MYRLHIIINHVPNLKCGIKIPILMINFHFYIFESIYNLKLDIICSKSNFKIWL